MNGAIVEANVATKKERTGMKERASENEGEINDEREREKCYVTIYYKQNTTVLILKEIR